MISAENIKTAEAWLDIDESLNGRETIENLINFRNVHRADAEAIVPMLLQKKAETASQPKESGKEAAVAVVDAPEWTTPIHEEIDLTLLTAMKMPG